MLTICADHNLKYLDIYPPENVIPGCVIGLIILLLFVLVYVRRAPPTEAEEREESARSHNSNINSLVSNWRD